MPDAKLAEVARTLEERSFPKIFAVELCAECNLSCAMCHHGAMRRPKGSLPLPLFERCADQIAATAPATDVWFSFCGEPLLEPERLFAALDYGHRAGLSSLNLNTNGVYLDAEIAERILDSPLSTVVVGIDGFTAPVYENARRGAKRDVVYANVEHLLARRAERGRGPEIMVQFIEMPENAHELEAFSAHWSSRGATLKIRNQLSWGGQIESALQTAAVRRRPVLVLQLELPAARPGLDLERVVELREGVVVVEEDRIPCPWAVTMMHVFWDGRVPRCPGDTEGDEGAGNAWEEPLEVLWARLGRYRQLHLERRFDELPARCQTCKDWMVGGSKKVRPSRLELVR